ncbi:DUF456 domain-containing protein [Marinilongibacter aquaticus]|uniref:DUF456 domain-containing protein n=1 Tax=Marinilongibacter aquaticus TaxID=2975157 RepID=UPI0021BD15CC|nr:DUF456 domain-containing protein [Marinilongibacter aquaticus]UBM59213.1 DUF456 domain-containing protein [Marinilongibacter aquaticus]
MDILLLILSLVCLLVGLAGSVLPLPGPPLSFVGLIVLHYSKFAHFSENTFIAFGLATLAVTVLDYYVPIWGTKKFGGTKAGVRGSTAGMLIGLFTGPWGIFIGAFLGALLGEMIWGDRPNALKAAIGSFAGFAAGIAMKLTLCLFMLYYAAREIFSYFQ